MATSDRLSDLPLSIMHLILARVPIRDAIRTSVLSRYWRDIWTTLPHLTINCVGDDDELTDEFDESTNNFISNVLLHHKGPIHRFKMSYFCTFSIDSIEEWVLCLARSDIKELIIETDLDGDECTNSLKSSIYLCAKLTKLKLWNFKMDPPPSTFKGFLFLTRLVLVGVELSPDGFETFLASCPLLERLSILYCSISELRIRSPNLKIVQIFGEHRKLSMYAPLLDELYVDVTVSQFSQSPVCNYTNFLSGFTNLVLFNGDGYFSRYLSIGIESCYTSLVFHQLNFIKLHEVNFREIAEISVVARLIKGAPNLHKLEIKARWSGRVDGAPDVSFKDYFGFAPNFMLEMLTDVSLLCVCGYPTGMQLVKFLLGISPVLETMELLVPLPSGPRFDELSAQVWGFHKASPDAEVSVSSTVTNWIQV